MALRVDYLADARQKPLPEALNLSRAGLSFSRPCAGAFAGVVEGVRKIEPILPRRTTVRRRILKVRIALPRCNYGLRELNRNRIFRQTARDNRRSGWPGQH